MKTPLNTPLDPDNIGEIRRRSASLKPSRKWHPMQPMGSLSPIGFPADLKLEPGETEWQNNVYAVLVGYHKTGWPFGGGPWARLKICSLDGEARHDWRDMQRIKNDIVGPEWEGIELFPSESRLIDCCNYYGLWCAPRIPIGTNEGRLFAHPGNCMAAQRGWSQDQPPAADNPDMAEALEAAAKDPEAYYQRAAEAVEALARAVCDRTGGDGSHIGAWPL